MQYDPIQGQGHEPSKVGNLTIFKGYLLPLFIIGGWQLTADSYIMAQYLKLFGARFFIFVVVFGSRDFEVGSK